MKWTNRIAFLYFLFGCPVARAQFPANIDSVYTCIKYNSVWRNSISDWKAVDVAFKDEIAAAVTMKDTLRSFVSVLKKLDDVHTQLYVLNEYFGYCHTVADSTVALLQPVITRASAENGKISTSLLANNIVYIRVPGMPFFGSEAINRHAQALSDSVNQYQLINPRAFTIDLRLNTGGNMYPMLAGLSSLLGDTVIGFETDAEGAVARKWEISRRNFFIGDSQVTNIKQAQKNNFNKSPVVVLTGPVTASSGSMTAIAFKQRPPTRFLLESQQQLGTPLQMGIFNLHQILPFFCNKFCS